MSGRFRLDIRRWCALVGERHITFSDIVPRIVLQLYKHPDMTKYNQSSPRMTNSDATPLSRETIEACYRRTGIRIKQGFVGSNGQLLPNMEAMFCDRAMATVRGPNVFLGYHNNAAATTAALLASSLYHKGNVGYEDARDNVFITKRVKERIKYKGSQVAPAALGGLLLKQPLVDDVAVIELEDTAQATKLPRAYVVLSGARRVARMLVTEAEEIVAWLAACVAHHKRLRGGVRFMDQILKNTNGHILRKELRDRAEQEAVSLSIGTARVRL